MRASEKLAEAINTQVGNEMFASMKYLSIASYFDAEALPTLARFFFRQAEEERAHAMKFLRFLLDIGAPVQIPAIAQAPCGFASAEDAVATALKSEESVTAQIEELVHLAEKERNLSARNLLNWFLEEQLEEESTMGDLLATVRRAGPDRLLDVETYLDREAVNLVGEGGAEA